MGFALLRPMRRSVLPLAVGTLAVCAWLHARGFSALVGGDLAAPRLHVLTEAQAATEPAPPRSADAILARNPFDSVTGPLLGGPPAPPPEPGTDVTTACEGVRVVSIVAFDDPDWSLVMLDVRGEREPILRRRGGDVLAIAPDRVLLQHDGIPCVARIFAPSSAPPSAPPASSARGIVRTGADSFALDRGARDALLDGAADVLLSLDGIPLTAPDRMLEAYARVRTEERVRVVVLRDGRQLQLDYQVR
jgi:general secretion pathway protein C